MSITLDGIQISTPNFMRRNTWLTSDLSNVGAIEPDWFNIKQTNRFYIHLRIKKMYKCNVLM